MSVKIHGTPVAPPAGLSPQTQKLWLAAARYRRLADLAVTAAQRAPQ